jgi:hypothetical protein
MVPACATKVLSFDPPTGSTALPVTLDGDATIANLSDSQADDLCGWLVANDPNAKLNPPTDRAQMPGVPGYVNAGGIGCSGPSASFLLGDLDQTQCVLNLRHSPCQATLSDLQQCVSYIWGEYAALAQSDADASVDVLDCASYATACSAFATAASCDQTVVQAAPPHYPQCAAGTYWGSFWMVATGALPIEAGASWPSVPDAGCDAQP